MGIDLSKRRWGRHFGDKEIAEARDSGRLLTMDLETSYSCNLRCIYCYSLAGAARRNELTLEEIFDVVEQGIDLGLKRVVLIGGGEPLMHPGIMDIVAFLDRKGLGIDMFTNGALIGPDTARRLFDHGVEPVVKLNSLKSEVQDYLVDTPGAYELIRRGIDSLIEAGYPSPDLDMGIETIVCAQNYDEIPELWRWARDRGIVPYVEMITFQGRARDRSELNVPVEDLRRLFYELAAIDREEYECSWLPHPPVAALSCSRHEYSCTITANGYVQPCTGIDIKVGNTRQNRLAKILAESDVMRSLRQIRRNIKGACRECEMLETCYGCRGMAYHFTGDYLAPDPLCWRNPEHIRIGRSCPIAACGKGGHL